MLRAVLFDMDGTLIDTECVYRECWMRAMKEMDVSIDTEVFFTRVAGMNMRTLIAFCKEAYGEDFPISEIRDRRRAYLLEKVERDGIVCKTGVPMILEHLRTKGIKLALASSSGGDWVRQCLRLAGIDESLFDYIITGDRVTRSKPDPEIFLMAADALGVKPSECVVAEDSTNGVLAGHAAGMKTVMIPDLQPCTDELRPLLWACIDTLELLPAMIQKYNESETYI